MTESEQKFFAAWWSAFGEAPTNVHLLLSFGGDDLLTAAAAIAPGTGYIGPISPTKLGRWLTKRSSDCIHLDVDKTLFLTRHDSTFPGSFWRLRPKEELVEAA